MIFRNGAKLSGLVLGALLLWPSLAGATTASSTATVHPATTGTSTASKSTSSTGSTGQTDSSKSGTSGASTGSGSSYAPVTGTNGPATVQQDLIALHPSGSTLQVEEQLDFAGTAVGGFKVPLIPGEQGLQVRGVSASDWKVVGTDLVLPSQVTQEVVLGYLLPMPTAGLNWNMPVYYPTSVKTFLTSGGLTLPQAANPNFYDMGSITSNVGPFERYASKPLAVTPALAVNVSYAPPAPSTGANGATPAPAAKSSLNSTVAIGAVAAILILVLVVFWVQRRGKAGTQPD